MEFEKFWKKNWKNLEFLINLTFSIVKFWFDKKIYHIDKLFCHHLKLFLLKNTFKVALQYLFNVVIEFNTVFYLKLNFKLKIDQRRVLSKTWKKFRKPGRNFSKTSGNPGIIYLKLKTKKN